MTAGIMQPYFFPYTGYFSLIKHTDNWIVFDPVQFIRHGWIERNRMLKQNEGWLYISVPLQKHERNTVIKNIQIRNEEKWQDKILAQIMHYKKHAPYYKTVHDFLREHLYYNTSSITQLNTYLLGKTCQYLGIPFQAHIFSEMNLQIQEPDAADEWALNICKQIGATTYINPMGGMEFFSREKYAAAGIELKFQQINLQPYKQDKRPFEAGLSILDTMMYNSPEAIRDMLNDVNYL